MVLMLSSSEIRKFFTATFAILSLALSMNLLAWKYRLVSSGITGYSFALNYIFSIPVGISLLILNGLILMGNILLLGKNVGAKALYGYITFCWAVEVTRYIFDIEKISISLNFVEQSLLLIILSALMAIFISMIIVNGYSVGSYSALLSIARKYIRISASKLFFIGDFILTLIVYSTFGVSNSAALALHSISLSFFLKYTILFFEKLNNREGT